MAQQFERFEQFVIDTRRALVHDHQVGLEAKDGIIEHCLASFAHFVCPMVQKAWLIFFGIHPIETGQLDVINTGGDAKGVNHWRAGDDEDGCVGKFFAQCSGQEQCAANVAQAKGIVRIEQDFGGGQHVCLQGYVQRSL